MVDSWEVILAFIFGSAKFIREHRDKFVMHGTLEFQHIFLLITNAIQIRKLTTINSNTLVTFEKKK